MRDFLIAMTAVPAMAILWFVVDNLHKRFSLRHPEFKRPPKGNCGSCRHGDGCGR